MGEDRASFDGINAHTHTHTYLSSGAYVQMNTAIDHTQTQTNTHTPHAYASTFISKTCALLHARFLMVSITCEQLMHTLTV